MAFAVVLLLLGVAPVSARQGGDWRTPFAAGEQARRAGDAATYAREMAAAVSAMPEGLGNRPFAQYHTARAYALQGDVEGAVRYLRMAWDEGVESLMITFAPYDPAFDAIREEPAFRAVMALPDAMTLTTRQLAPGTWLIDGAGAKLVASVGDDGVLLVDTGYEAALPALRRAIAAIGGHGIDLLVVTHPHEDHWGGVAALADEATVVAHPATAEAMSEPYAFMDGVSVPPRPAEARPDVLVRDTTFRFNGQDVRIVPMEAHTGGDIAVYLAGAGVLHMGDAWLGGNPLFFPGAADPDGLLDRVDGFLAQLPASTVVVGGHDDPADPATVRAQIQRTRECMALVRKAVADGVTLEQAVARAEGRFTAPWVGYFYRQFTAASGAQASL